MSMHPVVRRCLLCLCLALLAGSAVTARSAVTRTEAGNSYYSGGELAVTEPVQGDLFAAGGRVTLEQAVGADAAVAGGSVDIRSDVGQDLRAAGGNVRIAGQIGGELVAAGGTVHIADSGVVAGSSLLAGSDVIVDGRLGRSTRIYANRIVFNGEIDGDAHFHAQEIAFGPRARIDGNLFYASASPLPEEELSKVSGRVLRDKTPPNWSERSMNSGTSWFHPIFFFSMLASGFVLYLLFPNAVNGARESMARAPLRSIVVGLALLFTLPPVALILMLTLIGLPIGLGLFALYPLLLMLGYLAAAFFIGRKLADAVRQPAEFNKRKQALFLAAALLVLSLAGAVPVLGWLFVFVALVAGIGGWVIWAVRGYRTMSTNRPAAGPTS
jgi:cytoskeletal protein CcmA (bactofilin family)